MAEDKQPSPGKIIVLEGIEIKTELLQFGYVSLGLSKPRPGGYDMWARTATMHPDEAEALSVRLHELAERGKALRAERAKQERRHREATACP